MYECVCVYVFLTLLLKTFDSSNIPLQKFGQIFLQPNCPNDQARIHSLKMATSHIGVSSFHFLPKLWRQINVQLIRHPSVNPLSYSLRLQLTTSIPHKNKFTDRQNKTIPSFSSHLNLNSSIFWGKNQWLVCVKKRKMI